MTFKKFISLMFLPLLFTSFLFSQSVAELAKKEKERREKLKKKKSVVITNAGLKKTKKQSAVTTSRPAATTTKAKSPSSSQPKSPPGKTLSGNTSELDKTGTVVSKDQLEQKWSTAKEYVDLLTTKLNALWQEYYSMDDMTDRSSIQRQIAETFQKLEKAKEDVAKAKKELDQSSTRVIKKKGN